MRKLPGSPKESVTVIFDIETSPNLGFTWMKYEQDVMKFVAETKILCIGWKILGEEKTHLMAVWDYAGYRPGIFKLDDRRLLQDFSRRVLGMADVLVGHNILQFDLRMLRARMWAHGMRPFAKLQYVDTLKHAKSLLRLNSHKLADMGPYAGLGEKRATGGFQLWVDVLEGKRAAQKEMAAYCTQDVVLTEKLYLRLRPWMERHPNLNVIEGRVQSCPKCRSRHLQERGLQYTVTGTRQRYQCVDCGSWSSGPHRAANIIVR